MAKKKTTKRSGSKRRSKGKGSSKMGSFVDVQKLMGMGAGAFANSMVKKIPGTANLNPKILAAAKIIGGQMLPNQQFSKNAIASDSLRNGFGDALIYEGVKELMAGFGIAGLHPRRKPRGNEFLAVSIEGLEDPSAVNEDVLSEDEYDIGTLAGRDDLSLVNEDVLSDDVPLGYRQGSVNDDFLSDDLSSVNEDFLSEDLINDDGLL